MWWLWWWRTVSGIHAVWMICSFRCRLSRVCHQVRRVWRDTLIEGQGDTCVWEDKTSDVKIQQKENGKRYGISRARDIVRDLRYCLFEYGIYERLTAP